MRLLCPVFNGIDCGSTYLIGFHQLRMSSLGTFALKTEMKDHRRLNEVHFSGIHCLNGENFGQSLAVVSLVLEITVKLPADLNESCSDA
jgi:hypothetical protein